MAAEAANLENGEHAPLANGAAGKPAVAAATATERKPTDQPPPPPTTTTTTTPVANGNGCDGSLGSLRRVCLDAQRKVAAFLAEEPQTEMLRALQGQVRISLGVIGKALGDYRPEELSISYNGGKDCLVMLILILACLPRHFAASPADPAASPAEPQNPSAAPPSHQTPAPAPASQPKADSSNGITTDADAAAAATRPFPETLQAVYVVSKHPFAEVDEFVDRTAAEYHLSVERIAQSMRPALHAYLASRPAVRAVFVGTRRTDPHGESLTHFDPTDPGWPPFMRVHPVIDWHYAEIWAFIRHLGISYCSLYDQGYTSLGGTTDTSPNPALKRSVNAAEGAQAIFRPAYELMEDYEERLGRDR